MFWLHTINLTSSDKLYSGYTEHSNNKIYDKLCTWRHNMPPPALRQMLRLGRCGPSLMPAAQTHALLPIAVGAMNINDLMNINDVHESATIFPCPWKLTFDLESGVRVTSEVGYLCANFGIPRPLCSRVISDVHTRQTSDRQTSDKIIT